MLFRNIPINKIFFSNFEETYSSVFQFPPQLYYEQLILVAHGNYYVSMIIFEVFQVEIRAIHYCEMLKPMMEKQWF